MVRTFNLQPQDFKEETMDYERTVKAALSETKSRFELAEALALDIPLRQRGGSVEDEESLQLRLEAARQEIIDAGGEPRGVKTFADYRLTALWVSTLKGTTFRWIEGVAFTSHKDARASGLTYDQFASNPRNARQILSDSGRASKDGPPASIIPSWTAAQKAEAVREIARESTTEIDEAITDIVAARPSIAAKAVVRAEQSRAARTERIASGDSQDRRLESLTAIQDLGAACDNFSRGINSALLRVTDLPSSERRWLEGARNRAEEALAALDRFIELGRSEVDDFVSSVLREGQ